MMRFVSTAVALGAAGALCAAGGLPGSGPVEGGALFCSTLEARMEARMGARMGVGMTAVGGVAGDMGSRRAAASAADAPGPPFYAVDLVTTKALPGTARASGTGRVTFAPSPFGVAVGPDGSYVYDVSVRLQGMEPPSSGVLVAWLTTTQVDRIERLGALDGDLSVRGRVDWNKFLVVVTLESSDDPDATTWSGPIAFRGVSRSGLMHTMAGHGPFQQELCAKYGYR